MTSSALEAAASEAGVRSVPLSASGAVRGVVFSASPAVAAPAFGSVVPPLVPTSAAAPSSARSDVSAAAFRPRAPVAPPLRVPAAVVPRLVAAGFAASVEPSPAADVVARRRDPPAAVVPAWPAAGLPGVPAAPMRPAPAGFAGVFTARFGFAVSPAEPVFAAARRAPVPAGFAVSAEDVDAAPVCAVRRARVPAGFASVPPAALRPRLPADFAVPPALRRVVARFVAPRAGWGGGAGGGVAAASGASAPSD